MSELTSSQTRGIDRLYEYDRTLLSVPVGFGKTVVSQTAMQELAEDGQFNRFLVLAPYRVATMTWAVEHKEWEHLRAPAMATGPVDQRIAAIEGDNPIVVLNFENLVWFFERYGHEHGFDGLLVDESTRLKSVGGVQFRTLRRYLRDFTWRCAMTATLTEEGLEGLYAQTMIVDEGAALGTSKERFLTEHFYPIDFNRYKWKPFPGAMELLTEKISGLAFTVDDADYADQLPTLVQDYHFLDLPEQARAVYTEMAKEHLVTVEDTDELLTSAANSAVMTGKLQQICSGFVYDGDSVAHRIHSEKTSALARLVVPSAESWVIVYQFSWELEVLQSTFPSAPWLGAGVSEKRALQIAEDWNAKRVNVLLVHPKSAGHGVNLQGGGHRILFFGPLWSRDQTDQVIGRLRRRGQESDTVFVTQLVMRNTVEDQVMIPRVVGKGESAGLFREHLHSVVSEG